MKTMKTIGITQVRTTSSRLPNKILRKVNGLSLLQIHIERIRKAQKLDELIVATTTNSTDDVIMELCENINCNVSRGAEHDVLDRFYQALSNNPPTYVVRLTSDCPLIDPALIDSIIDFTINNNLDYCSNTLDPHYPDGQSVEVFKYSALEEAHKEAKKISEREHVTPYIYKNKHKFNIANFVEDYNYGHLRMTVDYEEDIEVINFLVKKLGFMATWIDYTNILLNFPTIQAVNKKYSRNHKYLEQIKQENL